MVWLTEDGPEMMSIYPKGAVESAIFERDYTGYIIPVTTSEAEHES